MDFGGGGASAASSASDAMSSALYAAIAQEAAARDQARADIAPWRQAGQTALTQYAGLLGIPGYDKVDPTATLQATPGYQWQLGQGVQALDRSAASRGLLTSGAQQKGLLNYGQGLANQTYNQYLGNVQGLQGQGQNAAAMQGQTSMNAANQMANLYGQIGQTQAQGILSGYNAQQQGLQGLLGGALNLAGMGVGLYTGAPYLFGNA